MPKVSIIVPIYNVEKYLKECLDSILSQTLKDIEILLIDDGSPDNCPAICDEYALKDSRIKVVHKQNGGYGAAVNTGIQIATGEYVAIVESDDWVSEYMYEVLYNKAQKSNIDIVKGSYCLVKNSKKYSMSVAYYLMLLAKNFDIFLFKDCPELLNHHTSIWSAIYNRKWLLDNNINFVEDIRPYEDLPFIAAAYTQARTMAIVPLPLYYYRTDAASSSMNSVSKTILNYPIQRERARLCYVKGGLFTCDFVENFYYVSYLTAKKFYKRPKNRYRKEFFYAMQKLLVNAYSDNLNFKHFSDMQKLDFINITRMSYNSYLIWSFLNSMKNIFIKPPIIKNNHKIFNILGIKIKTRIN